MGREYSFNKVGKAMAILLSLAMMVSPLMVTYAVEPGDVSPSDGMVNDLVGAPYSQGLGFNGSGIVIMIVSANLLHR